MPGGVLQPNGTKLRRLDHPQKLQHSFMVVNGRIIAIQGKIAGKRAWLGQGGFGHAKLAEDETAICLR